MISLSEGLSIQQGPTYHLKGKVIEKKNGEPIVGASITWNNGTEGKVTDVNGVFSVQLLSGNYKLTISAVGKKTITKEINIKEDKSLSFTLENDVVQLSEVTVRSTTDVTHLNSASMGVNRLSIQSIKQMPALMGEVDVMNSIVTLPGISSVGEGAGGINVRGGSVGQNLVLFDGAPIYYTSHLFGFFSVFNQDVTDNVTLYKGSMPARYGGRVSSVIAVESLNTLVDSMRFIGGIGLISSRLTWVTPVISNKLGLMVSTRTTYSDWLLKSASNPQLKSSSASFLDLNAKVDYQLNDRSKLTFSTYYGRDQFAFDADTSYMYGNFASTLNYHVELNGGMNFTGLATISDNFSSVLGDYSNQQFELNINNRNTSVKMFLGAELGQHYVEVGGEANIYELRPGNLKPTSEKSIVNEIKIENDLGREFGLFTEATFKFDKIKFITGLRYSAYQKMGSYTSYSYDNSETKSVNSIIDTTYYGRSEKVIDYSGLEPRISLSYNIDSQQSFKLGYQRTRQYMHLIANNVAIAPTDIYKLSNEHIEPQIGDQWSIGYFRNFRADMYESSAELYYRKTQNTIDYKDGAQLLLNNVLETELVNGAGIAYGAEFSLIKTAGKLTGRLSYTYSRAFIQVDGEFDEEVINEGKLYPAYYDKPHDFTTILSYKLSSQLSLNMNFTYSTGRPVSIPISKYEVGAIAIGEFSNRNQYRIPDFHRMDVSFNYVPQNSKRKFESSWTFGIYNLYGRKNPFSVFFRDQNGAPPQAYRLAILGIPFPSITYNFKF
ncbi:collagen-binding protein [Marivirga lumbricoides]|uniref:Collagen-binding protein n=2 Tax=Marivirga lumbricoides TaxID=1046115 RepID=A0ABQ1LIV2_9BACT|nr:collagen-binding protein [Marivirga lumbricoides]